MQIKSFIGDYIDGKKSVKPDCRRELLAEHIFQDFFQSVIRRQRKKVDRHSQMPERKAGLCKVSF